MVSTETRAGRTIDALEVPTTRLNRLIRFGLVGGSGLLVNQAALWLFTSRFGIHYMVSAVIATQFSTAWNFALTEGWVFRASSDGRLRRGLWFWLMNNAWLLLRAPLMIVLTSGLGINYLISNGLALAVATVVRFGISDSWIWSVRAAEAIKGDRTSELARPHRYDLHGVLRLESAVRLPELERFRVSGRSGEPDLTVDITAEGFGGLRRRAAVDKGKEMLQYVEHLGRFGFAMRIHLGDPIRVEASPFLARSPHVLYTNVVEPVLRCLAARHGFILAHAACLEIDGRGVLITARTDTGKTTTCLSAIRHQASGFVSDDMVLINADGVALGFPKPLTISAHTLRVARSASMSLGRRGWLQVQSRLHSRSGRRIGLSLTQRNLPVCTLNAIVQRLIPPPKFDVQAIIPGARIVNEVKLSHLALIELGDEAFESITGEESCVILEENTEDAYGFPPYPLIADVLMNGEIGVERAIRRSVVSTLQGVRIRTIDRSWYRHLPALVASERGE
jgi:dolichol-phosphate mannosyltransferase